jgi:hypothetical protein
LTYLKEHEGYLNFITDAWTSPNYEAFIAITIHFEVNGIPICILLDLVEVAKSHLGITLAAAFAQVLDNFRISKKVSNCIISYNCTAYLFYMVPQHNL